MDSHCLLFILYKLGRIESNSRIHYHKSQPFAQFCKNQICPENGRHRPSTVSLNRPSPFNGAIAPSPFIGAIALRSLSQQWPSPSLNCLFSVHQRHHPLLCLSEPSPLLLLPIRTAIAPSDAYAKAGEIGDARSLFDGVTVRDVLSWTTLVSGYARGGDMKSAREIFDAMPDKNSISWSTLASGYAHIGMGHHALKLLSEMIRLNVEPGEFTFSGCLHACASMNSLEHGRQLHSYLVTIGSIRPNDMVASSLIDMYSKCGSLEAATKVFLTMGKKWYVVAWNTMISALVHHGCCKEAIKTFVDLMRLGMKPNKATFIVLLNACKQSRLVQGGLFLFKSMTSNCRIVPDQEHYMCIIDLLGQSRNFNEMMDLIKKMQCAPDDCVWNAFLGVCRLHGDLELARLVSKHLVELEPRAPAACLLLSGIYASLGRWESAQEVRRHTNLKHVEEDKDVSWLEIERILNLETDHNKLQSPEKRTIPVWELLADGSSLFTVGR